jgi:DNA-directed RNA polymerase subunit K/omega
MSNEVLEGAPAEQEPERAAPITNRFLFVDVAAQRAKQLRRGARPRLGDGSDKPFKLERVAMREVVEGLIHYSVPPAKSSAQAEATR